LENTANIADFNLCHVSCSKFSGIFGCTLNGLITNFRAVLEALREEDLLLIWKRDDFTTN